MTTNEKPVIEITEGNLGFTVSCDQCGGALVIISNHADARVRVAQHESLHLLANTVYKLLHGPDEIPEEVEA